ncbi:MAG: hypothetical protein OEU32_11870 [Acidimicrobiia bacterium]|nr:hypothetical protein [Acidimicrobiia bacterium]
MRIAPQPIRLVAGLLAVGAFVAAVVVVTAQVEVGVDGVAASRTCGSPFDAITDRSGWQAWWANDLDEPDPAIRTTLVRTTECPGAVNQRLLAAGLSFGAALVAFGVGWYPGRHRDRPEPGTEAGRRSRRLRRLGSTTMVTGGLLTTAGVLGIIALVADADSTLFLYTDRFIVAVVGLIVLVPTISLIVLGRVLGIVGDHLDPRPEAGDVDP